MGWPTMSTMSTGSSYTEAYDSAYTIEATVNLDNGCPYDEAPAQEIEEVYHEVNSNHRPIIRLEPRPQPLSKHRVARRARDAIDRRASPAAGVGAG